MSTGYTPEEMRRYWRQHSRLWTRLDRTRDPEGLTNVCYNGAPLWLNRFAARCQRRAFVDLLGSVGPLQGRKALDVGCGTGRWSRLLAEAGASVTGIDLQPETLRDNRARLPACRFVEMSADTLGLASGSFDLVVAVTVLQHLPDESQALALSEIRRVLAPGGRVLLLEAARERGPHVFGNTTSEWIRRAGDAGLGLERALPYDYAPLLHSLRDLAIRIRAPRREDLPPVEEYVARFPKADRSRGLARSAFWLAMRMATIVSYPLEPICAATAPATLARHVGLLLRAA